MRELRELYKGYDKFCLLFIVMSFIGAFLIWYNSPGYQQMQLSKMRTIEEFLASTYYNPDAEVQATRSKLINQYSLDSYNLPPTVLIKQGAEK